MNLTILTVWCCFVSIILFTIGLFASVNKVWELTRAGDKKQAGTHRLLAWFCALGVLWSVNQIINEITR
jgi:hypothetical protein